MRSLYARLHRRYSLRKIPRADREADVRRKMRAEGQAPAPPMERTAAALAGKPRPKVAIVGGGFAGLMAGYALLNHADVTVFEARPRVGGRVWSKTKPSGVIEAGGELIGYNHPLWLRLARHFELGLSFNTSDTNFDALTLDMPVFLDGKKLSEKTIENVYKEMDKVLYRLCRLAVKVEKINPHKPWLSKNAKKLDAMTLSDWIKRQHCSRLARIAIEQQLTNDQGAPPNQQSFLANLAVIAGGVLGDQIDGFFTQTEIVRCSEGNGALAECLAKEIAGHGKVLTCSPVHAVRIGEGNVALDYRSGRKQDDPAAACIFPDDNAVQTFEADYVVLAIPPSLWPAAPHPQIGITPALPDDYYITMGTAVKYLSQVTHRFWIGEGLAPNATSTDFGVTWEGTDNQIAPPGRNVALSLFGGGGMAREALDEFKTGGKPAVDRFYGKRIGEIYPGYKHNLAGEPDFMAWPDDPWTRAGYSCPAPGEVTRAGPLLHKPFRERLFFAGEHTCFAYFGYMEGALQSGRRAADDIRRAIARKPSPRKSRSGTSSPPPGP